MGPLSFGPAFRDFLGPIIGERLYFLRKKQGDMDADQENGKILATGAGKNSLECWKRPFVGGRRWPAKVVVHALKQGSGR